MIWMANSAHVIPASGVWEGNSAIERVVAHPALLFAPRRNATDQGQQYIEQELLDVPQSVIAAMWAKKWDVEIDITGPGGALTTTTELTANVTTWREVITAGHFIRIDTGFPDDPEEDYTRIQMSVDSSAIQFIGTDTGRWWPGFDALINSAKHNPFPTPDVLVQAVEHDGGASSGETGIVVEIDGDFFPTYYAGSGDFGLSGTIKLTPTEWLDVL